MTESTLMKVRSHQSIKKELLESVLRLRRCRQSPNSLRFGEQQVGNGNVAVSKLSFLPFDRNEFGGEAKLMTTPDCDNVLLDTFSGLALENHKNGEIRCGLTTGLFHPSILAILTDHSTVDSYADSHPTLPELSFSSVDVNTPRFEIDFRDASTHLQSGQQSLTSSHSTSMVKCDIHLQVGEFEISQDSKRHLQENQMKSHEEISSGCKSIASELSNVLIDKSPGKTEYPGGNQILILRSVLTEWTHSTRAGRILNRLVKTVLRRKTFQCYSLFFEVWVQNTAAMCLARPSRSAKSNTNSIDDLLEELEVNQSDNEYLQQQMIQYVKRKAVILLNQSNGNSALTESWCSASTKHDEDWKKRYDFGSFAKSLKSPLGFGNVSVQTIKHSECDIKWAQEIMRKLKIAEARHHRNLESVLKRQYVTCTAVAFRVWMLMWRRKLVNRLMSRKQHAKLQARAICSWNNFILRGARTARILGRKRTRTRKVLMAVSIDEWKKLLRCKQNIDSTCDRILKTSDHSEKLGSTLVDDTACSESFGSESFCTATAGELFTASEGDWSVNSDVNVSQSNDGIGRFSLISPNSPQHHHLTSSNPNATCISLKFDNEVDSWLPQPHRMCQQMQLRTDISHALGISIESVFVSWHLGSKRAEVILSLEAQACTEQVSRNSLEMGLDLIEQVESKGNIHNTTVGRFIETAQLYKRQQHSMSEFVFHHKKTTGDGTVNLHIQTSKIEDPNRSKMENRNIPCGNFRKINTLLEMRIRYLDMARAFACFASSVSYCKISGVK